jgi:hypothetical protein
MAATSINLTQYGTICVFIVLMGNFVHDLSSEGGVEVIINC